MENPSSDLDSHNGYGIHGITLPISNGELMLTEPSGIRTRTLIPRTVKLKF